MKSRKKYHIRLQKDTSGLGCTITTRDNPAASNNAIYIKTILPRGPAIIDGRLRQGDRLLEVNGIDMTGVSQEEAVSILKSIPVGAQVDMIVSRQEQETSSPPLPRKMNQQEEPKPLNAEVEVLTFAIPLNDTGSAGLGVSVKGKTQRIRQRIEQQVDSSAEKEEEEDVMVDLGIFVKSVIHGGAASKDGRLQPNHQLISINGISLLGLPNTLAMETLRSAMMHPNEGPTAIPGHIVLSVTRRVPKRNNKFEEMTASSENGEGSSGSSDIKQEEMQESSLERWKKYNAFDQQEYPEEDVEQEYEGHENHEDYDDENVFLEEEEEEEEDQEEFHHENGCEQEQESNQNHEETKETNHGLQENGTEDVDVIEEDVQFNDETASTEGAQNDSSQEEEESQNESQAQDEEEEEEEQEHDPSVIFNRHGFGRQSMSEKRHAHLDAKETDTYQRSKRAREEKLNQEKASESDGAADSWRTSSTPRKKIKEGHRRSKSSDGRPTKSLQWNFDEEIMHQQETTSLETPNKSTNKTPKSQNKTPIFSPKVCCWTCQSSPSGVCAAHSTSSVKQAIKNFETNPKVAIALGSAGMAPYHHQQQGTSLQTNLVNPSQQREQNGNGKNPSPSSSLENLNSMMQDLQRLQLEASMSERQVIAQQIQQQQPVYGRTGGTRVARSRATNESFRAAVDRSYDAVVQDPNMETVAEESELLDHQQQSSHYYIQPHRSSGRTRTGMTSMGCFSNRNTSGGLSLYSASTAVSTLTGTTTTTGTTESNEFDEEEEDMRMIQRRAKSRSSGSEVERRKRLALQHQMNSRAYLTASDHHQDHRQLSSSTGLATQTQKKGFLNRILNKFGSRKCKTPPVKQYEDPNVPTVAQIIQEMEEDAERIRAQRLLKSEQERINIHVRRLREQQHQQQLLENQQQQLMRLRQQMQLQQQQEQQLQQQLQEQNDDLYGHYMNHQEIRMQMQQQQPHQQVVMKMNTRTPSSAVVKRILPNGQRVVQQPLPPTPPPKPTIIQNHVQQIQPIQSIIQQQNHVQQIQPPIHVQAIHPNHLRSTPTTIMSAPQLHPSHVNASRSIIDARGVVPTARPMSTFYEYNSNTNGYNNNTNGYINSDLSANNNRMRNAMYESRPAAINGQHILVQPQPIYTTRQVIQQDPYGVVMQRPIIGRNRVVPMDISRQPLASHLQEPVYQTANSVYVYSNPGVQTGLFVKPLQ